MTTLYDYVSLAQQVYGLSINYLSGAFLGGMVTNLHTLIKGQNMRYIPCVMRVYFIQWWRSAARGRVMPICTETLAVKYHCNKKISCPTLNNK